jgi:hypothetical protein
MTLYKGPHSLFRALAPKYRLNKAEYLQIYNLRPVTQVTLELIIEEVRLVFCCCFVLLWLRRRFLLIFWATPRRDQGLTLR